MPRNTKPRTITASQAARLRKLSAYQAGPSLFRDHPASALDKGPAAQRIDEQARAVIASWEAHRAAGEVPVIVSSTSRYGGTNVEWRKVAGEQVAA